MTTKQDNTARAIQDAFHSTCYCNSQMEPANLVDVGYFAVEAMRSIASAITPQDAAGGNDAFGGRVESLTEAVVSISTGAAAIAEAIHDLAAAIRESHEKGRPGAT